jgi:hypothetical protein
MFFVSLMSKLRARSEAGLAGALGVEQIIWAFITVNKRTQQVYLEGGGGGEGTFTCFAHSGWNEMLEVRLQSRYNNRGREMDL